ncbi:MAG: hypothetical protein ACD_79C01202G0001 [uncultured bacterium]|nr:MAG: hypothetical protein ACD_79C01202G0001 [uncultured bacterium]
MTSTVLPSDTLLFSMKNYFASGIHVNPKNCDYPLILAIITGSFNHFEGNHKKVSEYLKTTPSQVVKFITDNKHLLEKINSIRKKFNKPNLH